MDSLFVLYTFFTPAPLLTNTHIATFFFHLRPCARLNDDVLFSRGDSINQLTVNFLFPFFSIYPNWKILLCHRAKNLMLGLRVIPKRSRYWRGKWQTFCIGSCVVIGWKDIPSEMVDFLDLFTMIVRYVIRFVTLFRGIYVDRGPTPFWSQGKDLL